MSANIITARDPGIIAAEINYIKRETAEKIARVALKGEIAIGEKLCEAKSMVPHGEWGKWLLENVEYQQSTAEKLMKIYKEYGNGQIRIDDTWRNSETFQKLTWTKHCELLAIPYEERQKFAEEHNVEKMSTRQLQQAIRERDEALQQAEAAEAAARDAEHALLDLQQKHAAAKSDESAWQQEIEKLKKAVSEANSVAAEAEKKKAELVKSLEDNLEKLEKAQDAEAKAKQALKIARAAEKESQDALQKVRENPDIPESMMEQLRKEAESAAAKKATEEAQKKVDEANRAREAAEAATKEVQEKLDTANRRLKMADPAVMEFNTLAQKLMADYNVMDGLRRKISVSEKEVGEKLLAFQKAMLAKFSAAVDGK